MYDPIYWQLNKCCWPVSCPFTHLSRHTEILVWLALLISQSPPGPDFLPHELDLAPELTSWLFHSVGICSVQRTNCRQVSSGTWGRTSLVDAEANYARLMWLYIFGELCWCIGIIGLLELAQLCDMVLLVETCLNSPLSGSCCNYLCALSNVRIITVSRRSAVMPQASPHCSEKGTVCWSVCIMHPSSAQISKDLGLSWLSVFDPPDQAVQKWWFTLGGPKCSPRIARLGRYDNYQAKKSWAAHT